MSRVGWSTADVDPEYWYLDFMFETDNGKVFSWSYSRMFHCRTIVEELPQDYYLDDLPFFTETTKEINWG